jgi:hypothetical protein
MPTELEHRAEGHYLIGGQTLKNGKFWYNKQRHEG